MPVQAKTEDLEMFITIVDCGSFSGAASLLDLNVAKVSRALSRLESRLNCTLLNRTTRRLELTEEGHIHRICAKGFKHAALRGRNNKAT